MTDRTRTPADLEQTFRDVTDPDYTAGLGAEGPGGLGLDPVAAHARTIARASDAVRRNTQAYFLLPSSQQADDPASAGVFASGPITITRIANFPLEITIPAGTPLELTRLDTVGGPANMPDFRLAEPVTFAVGAAGPLAGLAVADRLGDQGNVRAGTVTGFEAQGSGSIECTIDGDNFGTDTGIPDVFFEGLIGRYCEFTAGANLGEVRRVLAYSQAAGVGTVFFDGSSLVPGSATVRPIEWRELFTVTQAVDFTNGRHPNLDAIGRERGLGRAVGESDINYAYRLSILPDVISPAAIDRICASILSPYGIRYRIYETREDIEGLILDESPLDNGSICPDEVIPYSGGVLLSLGDSRQFFTVCVSAAPNLGVYGLPFDAPNAGINAFDSGSNPGDGSPLTYNQVMQALYSALVAAKGFGVQFELVQDPTL